MKNNDLFLDVEKINEYKINKSNYYVPFISLIMQPYKICHICNNEFQDGCQPICTNLNYGILVCKQCISKKIYQYHLINEFYTKKYLILKYISPNIDFICSFKHNILRSNGALEIDWNLNENSLIFWKNRNNVKIFIEVYQNERELKKIVNINHLIRLNQNYKFLNQLKMSIKMFLT